MSRRDSREGEISDGDSLEEITAEDFEHDARGSSRSRVWMQDLMRHRLPRGYETCLYNFAWAQAAQNRPLGIGLPVADSEDVVAEESGEKVGGEEDDEKDDGELEEGEIELGSEPMELDGAVDSSNDKMGKKIEVIDLTENKIEEIGEFDKRVSLILEELETVTEEDAKASLETVCVRLRKSFESLKLMHSDSGLPVLSALVQQAFMGMQTVHSVVIASNTKKNEDLLLRLLIHIRNQYSILLTADQLKELDGMVQSLVSSDSKGSSTSSLSSHAAVSSSNLSTSGKGNSWSRVDFSPLLDLHADYDEGSLPSPTRENAPPLPYQKPVGFGMAQPVPVGFGMAQPVHSKNVKPEIDAFQPYDPEAFKAVSSYQQKYKTSFPESNRLPSPTPSEDGDCDNDIQGEVSSSPVLDNARVVNSSSSSLLLWSGFSGARTPTASGLQIPPLTTAVRAPGKSRDPRLRVLNPEVSGTSDQNRLPLPVEASSPIGFSGSSVNPRKHKATELLLDNRPLKRERNGFVNSRDVQMAPGSSVLASQSTSNFNLMNSGIGQNPSVASVPAVSTSTASAVSLPSLFKDMAVNPTMIMQLFQMKQHRLAEQSQQKTTDPACNPILNPNASRFPGPVSAENGTSLKTSEREHNSPERSQLPAQTVSLNVQNDVGRIRMKPRDPRRILHNNTAVKIESSKFGSANVNGTSDTLSSKDILKVREQGEQAQTTGLPSHPALQPDIARLFTKNLKNVADMISSTLSANTSSAVSQDTSQPIPRMINKADVVALTVDLNGQKNVSGLPRERSAAGASQEPNPWGDVDHLLDGYDDQQKASIQRERARRIEEQNKMFAARKLCLVLDLDHTLLNSAKFIEVDPIHDEILRKKEEQDREKPQRHLFRFPHMGMWTKLRPGIWNFLERASKLFELHLYTMGNKLYATEMAKVLDPTGTLFAGRVISRGDDNDPLDGDERVPKSKDLDGVLGMESAVVIIDDSVRVWPHNKLNLIIVERYTYFPCSRRQFGLPGPSLLEIDHDERPEAGTLASSLAVIERLHSIFFSNRSLNDVDVRNILAAEQRKILAGCRVVFSRIFPVGEASPHLHPLWQTAEQFGAVCTNFIDEQVTHVVANSPGTDKVNWALSTGRFVVQPGWVEASALLYRRANEHEFAIKI